MTGKDGIVFLVVEPDLLIARDLDESLRAGVPGAEVCHARGADEASEALDGIDHLAAAFLRLPREALDEGSIPREVEARGGRVVILDAPAAAPPATDDDWLYVGRPFGADAIPSVLRRLGMSGGHPA